MERIGEVAVLSRWRHKKKGTVYIVTGFVTNRTNGPDDGKVMVLYRPAMSMVLDVSENHTRTMEQFTDGRFEEVLFDHETGKYIPKGE